MYLGKVNLFCETQGNSKNSHFLPKTELPFQNHIEIGYSHWVGGRGFCGKTANRPRRHMEHIDEHRDKHLPDLSLYRSAHYTDCQSMVLKEATEHNMNSLRKHRNEQQHISLRYSETVRF